MPNHTSRFIRKGGLLSALIAAIFAPQAYAVPAGRVDFSVGKVLATGSDGVSRDLVKGAEVNAGDSINTGSGRIQIRFTDGAYMSLQPNTVFKVENYAFNGKADGEEKGVFSLLTGGLRTISGLIGKGKRENYELRTKTATIGIRGTAYSANQTEDTLTVTVGEGRISVTNQGGNLLIGSGQSAVVRSPQLKPEMTNEKALAPKSETPVEKPQTPEQGTAAAAGEQRVSSGKALVVADVLTSTTPTPTPVPTPTPTPVPTVLVTGPGYSIAHASLAPPPSVAGAQVDYSNFTGTFDAGGTLTGITDGSNSLTLNQALGGAAADSGSDTLIGWGRWGGPIIGTGGMSASGGSAVAPAGLHYIVGKAVSVDPLVNPIYTSGTTVSYSVIGATTPTVLNGATVTLGSVSPGGGASVNFALGNVTLSMNFTVNTPIPRSYAMGTVFPNVVLNYQGTLSAFTGTRASVATCSTGCTLTLQGMFTGANADRLGFAYLISDQIGAKTAGAIAFTKFVLPP
jgi:hypothetical protein